MAATEYATRFNQSIAPPENNNWKTLVITPRMAEELLEKNTNNRNVSPAKIKRYATAMEEGRWKQNGETLKMSLSGRLMDGQHRLMAIIKTGTPQTMTIASQLAEDAVTTIDCGMKRTTAHTLEYAGLKNCKPLAATLNILKRLTGDNVVVKDGYHNDEVVEAMKQFPGVETFVTETSNWNTFSRTLPKTWQAALYYLFYQKDATASKVFFDSMNTGVNLSDGDPVLLLRQRLIRNQESTAKFMLHHLGALVIICWNAERQGKQIKNLNWKPGVDVFPEII